MIFFEKRNWFSTFLIFVSLMIFTGAVFAESPVQKTVKIGYYQSDYFQEGMSDNAVKSGFCYEYLQKIGAYSGWRYEYIYGDWGTLFEKFEKGEIDLLAGVSKTEERLSKMNFPNYSMGTDRYFLYQHEDNPVMKASDLSTIEGKTIGGIENNRMTTFLEIWGKNNKVNLNIKYYSGFDARNKDFGENKLDGITGTDNNTLKTAGLVPVLKIGEEPYYLAVAKKRADLLDELNRALTIMNDLEPYFLQNLQYNSYGNTASSTNLTLEEEKWIKNHKLLRVGYLAEYMPYCGIRDDGTVDGLVGDVFEAIFEKLKLKNMISIRYKVFNDYESMVKALHSNDIDVIFPVGGGMWYVEKDGLDETSPVVTSGMELVYKGDYDKKSTARIAVNRNNRMQYNYSKINFPDSEIFLYDSIEQCLDAVKNEEVNCTVINGLRINLVLKNKFYGELNALQLEKNDSRCIGIEGGNYPLMLLLNRGIKAVGRDFGINASYRYANKLYDYSARDFIHENYLIIVATVVLVSVIILILFGAYVSKVRHEVKERGKFLTKLEKERQKTNEAMHESNTDTLTGFFNRRAFENDSKDYEISELPLDFSVISLDLNGLKNVNDEMGHSAGDELIEGAADCIRLSFGTFGKLYRTGGDEFMVFFQGETSDVSDCVENLRARCENWHGTKVTGLAISCGWASVSEFANISLQQLEAVADKRMYEDKSLYYNDKRNRRRSRDNLAGMFNSFIKVLKVDLVSDTFQIVKMNEAEKSKQKGFSMVFSTWIKDYALSGQVSKETLKDYVEKFSSEYILEYFKNNSKPLQIHYERIEKDEFVPVVMEIVPAESSEDEKAFYIFVKREYKD